MFQNFGFIGLGLIGGSIARCLRSLYPSCRITAYSRRTALSGDIAEAIRAKVVDDAVFALSGLSECDLIFLCAPVENNISYIGQLAPLISSHTVLTDVGSVKSGIHEAVRAAGLSERFIGGHPMTGSERNGFSNSSALLMENAYYAVTAEPSCPAELVEAFVSLVRAMKSIPVILTTEEHDDAVSAISHVPHLIAAQLVNLVRTSERSATMKLLAAGGFKDITRIASSSPTLWEGILSSNKSFVLPTLKRYISLLNEAYDILSKEQPGKVATLFEEAGAFRNSLSERKGVLPEQFLLYADIRDEAGAIATFATLLANNRVSLKNIGIVHNREFERGVLRIEFYDKDALEKAFTLLRSNNYTIYR